MVLEQFIIDADIIWDQVGKTFFENPEAKPGRIMRVQVVNAGIIEDLTGYTLNLGWTSVRDPSKFGLDAFDVVDITKGIFEIEYTSGMLTNIGPLNASLQLVPPGLGRPIESNNFKLTVKNSAINPEAIQGETSFSTLENALVEVNGWNARIDLVEQEFKDRADALDGAYPVRLVSVEQQASKNGTNIENEKVNNLTDLDLSSQSLVIAGIDSLTNGAGGNAYYDFFQKRLKAVFGDGGVGYVSFDNGKAITEGDSFGVVGFSSIMGSSDASKQYSFDGHGLYGNNLSNAYINYELSATRRNFSRCKLFYLKQPSGGSFYVSYLTNAGALINTQLVETASETFDLGVLEMPVMNKSFVKGLGIRSANGKVAIFGAYLHNDKGVAVCRIGKGGLTFQSLIDLNSTFQTKWKDALNPKLFLLNAGMNDGKAEVDYKAIIETYVARFPNTKFLLISPNDTSASPEFIKGYERVLAKYAKDNKHDYLSIRQLLGDYSVANSNGLMYDSVHPNEKGNRLIANKIMDYYSLPKITNSQQLNPAISYTYSYAGAISIDFTFQVPSNGVYLLTVQFLGNYGDANHQASATYLVNYLTGDTFKLKGVDLVGTVKKTGNMIDMTFTSISDEGLLTFNARQVNALTSKANFTIIKLSL